MKKYDYLIVGSGLFGATFAYLAHQQGKKSLVIDKRAHLGGNIYCEYVEGINVHKYGAHIFHTSNKQVWDFVNSMVEFNRYTNSPGIGTNDNPGKWDFRRPRLLTHLRHHIARLLSRQFHHNLRRFRTERIFLQSARMNLRFQPNPLQKLSAARRRTRQN